MQETQVQSLGGEDLLEEGMAAHSSTPARRIPRTKELDGLESTESQRVGHNWSDLDVHPSGNDSLYALMNILNSVWIPGANK